MNWQTAVDRAWDYRRFNYGFTNKEILSLLRELKIHHKTFWKKFGDGNTCALDESGETLYYLCDVFKAIQLIKEKREMRVEEWD